MSVGFGATLDVGPVGVSAHTRVKLLVVFAGTDQEVFWPVVGADAVDVVDDLSLTKTAPQCLLSDQHMFIAPLLAPHMHNYISGFPDGSVAYGALGKDVVAGRSALCRFLLGRVVLPPGLTPCAPSVPITWISSLNPLAAQPSVDGCHWYAGFVADLAHAFPGCVQLEYLRFKL
ncbi:hypothetical protein AW928_13590 [Pseudomonas aeruginosa]|nr:hypothetical protein AW928_13590 [Pseudomonas aeruginosa]